MSEDQQQKSNTEAEPNPDPTSPPSSIPSTSNTPKGFDSIDWIKKSQDPAVTRKDRDDE